MEQKNLLTIDISKQDHKDLISFCELNEITDIDGFVKLCFRKGYYIERYGLLNQGQLPEVIDRAPFDNDGYGGSKSGENYLAVHYEKIIPLLIEAIKELDSKIK